MTENDKTEEPSTVETDEYLKYDGTEFTGWSIIKHSGILPTIISALVGATVLGVTAYYLGSPWFIALAVLGGYLSFIGWVDYKTFLIKNAHTALFLPVFVVAFLANSVLIATSETWGINNTNPALIEPFNYLRFAYGMGSGVLVALVMLALIIFANFRSGGDIKLSPLVAFSLGFVGAATAPVAGADGTILALSWFLISTTLTLIHMGAVRVIARKKIPVPFGVSMVVALPLALLVDHYFITTLL